MYTLPASPFLENISILNNLDRGEIRKLVLQPGMGFGDMKKWWTKDSLRKSGHEGMDFRLYRNAAGKLRQFSAGTIIGPMFKGTVFQVTDDFLGQSVWLRHACDSVSPDILVTVYGHLDAGVIPDHGRVGLRDCLGTIAPGSSRVPAHLHLTVALMPPAVDYLSLSWETMQHAAIQLINPLKLLNIEIDEQA